jgi:hypothetical protein
MRRLLVFVLLLLSLRSQAQTGFEVRQKLGFLIAHRPVMAHLPQAPAVATELSYIVRTTDRKTWHQAYHQPLIGGTLFFGSVGNNQILGHFTGLYGFVELPIIHAPHYRLDFKFGTGAGYTNRPYDPVLNPKNVAIGSHFNAMMCFALKNSWRFGTHGLTLGLDMTHFSNASFTIPNLGINLPYLSVGYQHYIATQKVKANPIQEINRHQEFGLTLIGSGKEMTPLGSGRFPVLAASVQARHYFGPKAGLELGLDIIYKASLLHAYPGLPLRNIDPLQLAVFAAYMHPFDRLQFFYGVGAYLRDPLHPDTPVYFRLGCRYAFTTHVDGHFALKTHFAKADYLEFGLAYHFNRP